MFKGVKTVAGFPPSHTQMKICCKEMRFGCLYQTVMGNIVNMMRKNGYA